MTDTTTAATTLLFEVTDLKQWMYCPRVLYYHRPLTTDDRRPTCVVIAQRGSHD